MIILYVDVSFRETLCSCWVQTGERRGEERGAASAVSAWEKPRAAETSTRDVSWPKHNWNYTGGLRNYTDEANYTYESAECLGVVVVKCKTSGLWDFGLPGRLIRQGLPSARRKAPSTGNQALHCCWWRTGSVISWWIYWCLKHRFTPTYY